MQACESGERNGRHQLSQLGKPWHRFDDAGLHLDGRCQLIEIGGQRSESRLVVQVGDGYLRITLPQRRNQLSGGQRPAAQRKEIGLRSVDGGGQDVPP
ncbi:Uncharacterised protein [Mycobacteroides abscessus subsp. abscessus]|nr:Uncharacterised protein [Mycobacteroides abscessus subsp. abscessus]